MRVATIDVEAGLNNRKEAAEHERGRVWKWFSLLSPFLLFSLVVICVAVLFCGGVYFASTQNDSIGKWWPVLNFIVFFANATILSILCVWYKTKRFRDNHKLRVAHYYFSTLNHEGLIQPREFTELARRKQYWPKGEFKSDTLEYFRAKDFWSSYVHKNSCGFDAKSVVKCATANLSLKDWRCLRDHVNFTLSGLFHHGYIEQSFDYASTTFSDRNSEKVVFLWFLREDETGNQTVSLMKSVLHGKIAEYSMTWENFTNERGDFAGCKVLKRRNDGEWIGECGGHDCPAPKHTYTKEVFKFFQSFEMINLETGCLLSHEHEDENDFERKRVRFVLGQLETFDFSADSNQKNRKKKTQPVWTAERWKAK
uniref:Uncharacterized protein n=1 Tax=Aplanochytrium stocchinoi TaxID=215587 RepID=A0A7S3LSW3_9STRA|mmetsp:Transcript_11042/g.13810  ORF Transcript_11042/g.13810 Transcript_11042/m.13810 type:complete len:368 (+) Transcript_11042:152-1255(+)